MTSRNITWVHTGGYPFYFSWRQDSGLQEWGVNGFQRLMSHINKGNVDCWPPDSEKIRLNTLAEATLMHGWYEITAAFWVERGRPLKGSSFGNYTILPIWGTRDGYMTGAIIKFAKLNQTQGLGFYVHIGAGQAYESDGEIKTDRDFYSGYVGAAAAIWTCAWRSVAEDAIVQAEEAIAKAEKEGRTKGLEDARTFLQNAKALLEAIFRNDHKEASRLTDLYIFIKTNNGFGTVALRTWRARDIADKAVTPSFIEAYALPLTIIGVICVASTTGLAIRWKINSKKEKDAK